MYTPHSKHGEGWRTLESIPRHCFSRLSKTIACKEIPTSRNTSATLPGRIFGLAISVLYFRESPAAAIPLPNMGFGPVLYRIQHPIYHRIRTVEGHHLNRDRFLGRWRRNPFSLTLVDSPDSDKPKPSRSSTFCLERACFLQYGRAIARSDYLKIGAIPTSLSAASLTWAVWQTDISIA